MFLHVLFWEFDPDREYADGEDYTSKFERYGVDCFFIAVAPSTRIEDARTIGSCDGVAKQH